MKGKIGAIIIAVVLLLGLICCVSCLEKVPALYIWSFYSSLRFWTIPLVRRKQSSYKGTVVYLPVSLLACQISFTSASQKI